MVVVIDDVLRHVDPLHQALVHQRIVPFPSDLGQIDGSAALSSQQLLFNLGFLSQFLGQTHGLLDESGHRLGPEQVVLDGVGNSYLILLLLRGIKLGRGPNQRQLLRSLDGYQRLNASIVGQT